jgi:hypothetical protein
LVEEDHAENTGIEVPAHGRAAPAAGSAMENHDGQTLRISTLLDIQAVAVSDLN